MQPMSNGSSQPHASASGNPSEQTQEGANINPNPLLAAPIASTNNIGSSSGVPPPTPYAASRPPSAQSSGSNMQAQQQQHILSNWAQISLKSSRYLDLLERVVKHPLAQLLTIAALPLTVQGLRLATQANELSKEAINQNFQEVCRNHPVSPFPMSCRIHASYLGTNVELV